MFVGPALGVKRYPRRAQSRFACYSVPVGRLDNIVARNRRPSGLQERVIVSTVFGLIVLLVIALAVFTDLGLPPEARDAPDARDTGPAAGAVPDHSRVNRVLLRQPSAKPAPTPAPATQH